MRSPVNGLLAALGLGLWLFAVPAGAATILHLSSTATVEVMPDELGARLAADATAATPSDAQAAVNLLIGRALAVTRGVTAVTASTGSYSVWQVTDPHPEWHASQMLILSATDGKALLGLVGELQGDGLAVASLAWRLQPETERAAHDKAEALALAALKGKAERAAQVLGLKFTGFRAVWLTPPVAPPPRPMAMMAARAVPEPNAVAGEAAISATVTAEVTLEP